MKWQRWHAFAAGGALLLGLGGVWAYGRSTPSEPSLDAGVVETVSPPARSPDDILAEIYLSSPNATWGKLQRGVGGALGILPMTLPGVIVALSDLDVQLASELDGASPMHAALAGDPADPTWAVAMKLNDGRRARGLLVEGDTARFDAREEAGMSVLVPRQVASPGERERVVAISSNGWLVVARDASALPKLGSWVTRGLPARPPPSMTAAAVIDVPRLALTTTLGPKLKALWDGAKIFLIDEDKRMRAERGRAPDFGDPAAIVAALDRLVSRRIAIVSDFDHVRVTLDVTDDAVLAHAVLTPPPGGSENAARMWVDAMSVGEPAPVLALPASATAAVSLRDAEPARKDQAESLEETLASVLGSRLKDPAPLHAVIDGVTKARADVAALAIGLDDPSGTYLRLPIRDAAAARTAAAGAVELLKNDPFREILRAQSLSQREEEVVGSGPASVLVIAHPKPDAGPARRDTGIAWLVEEKEASAAYGPEPMATLRAGLKDKKLVDLPALKRFLEAIGNDASTIVITQPLKLDARRSALPPAPAGLAIGKRDGAAFVHLDVPDALLKELSRRQLGL